jgi:hypothetical protein
MSGLILHQKFVRLLIAGLLGAMAFSYFFISNHYYAPKLIRIEGIQRHDSVSPHLIIEWNGGKGFQSYLKQQISIDTCADGEVGAGSCPFATSYELPFQFIKRFRLVGSSGVQISKVLLESAGQSEELFAGTPTNNEPIRTDIVQHNPLTYNLMLFTGQLIGALLVSLLVYLMWPVCTYEGRQIAVHWFLKKQGYVFCLMLLVSFGVHLLWVIGYWPAQMTNDSWATVSDVAALRLNDWHPYVYTLYVLVLFQFFPSVATVAIFQMFVTTLIFSYIFYYCLRRGVSGLWIAVFFMLFVFSIPIGLMSAIIWKDVPFSLGVLLISVISYHVHLERMRTGRRLQISGWIGLVLAVAILFACHMRHNGIIYYGIVPVLLVWGLAWRDLLRLSIFMISMFVIVCVVVPRVAEIKKTSGSPYHEVRTALSIMTHYNFYSENREDDYKRMERYLGLSWQEIKSLYPHDWFAINDRGVAQHQYKPDLGYSADSFNKEFLMRLIVTNLPIFFSARVFDFLHSISIDSSHSDVRNGYFQNPCQLTGSNLWPPGNMVFNHALSATRPMPPVSNFVEKVDKYARTYGGLFSPQVLVWNLSLPLVVFCVIVAIERIYGPIVVFLMPHLAGALGVFMLGAGESWRYFYYLYLAWIVVIPLYILQLRCLVSESKGEANVGSA